MSESSSTSKVKMNAFQTARHFCTKCGGSLREGDMFCGRCGARIEESAPAVEPKNEQASASQPQQPRIKNGLKLPPKRTIRLPTKADMTAIRAKKEFVRAGKIGYDLGESSLLVDDICCVNEDIGIRLLAQVNPLMWKANSYKAQAKSALSNGDLDLAEAMRKKGDMFRIMANLSTIAIFAICILVFLSCLLS